MKAGVEIFGFITMTLSFFGLADIIFEILSYEPPNFKKNSGWRDKPWMFEM